MQDFAAKTPLNSVRCLRRLRSSSLSGSLQNRLYRPLRQLGMPRLGSVLGRKASTGSPWPWGQMAKSKVQAGEMMQLTETGIPAWKMLADQIGVSVPEAMSMVSKGAIDAATGITALVSGMEQSFGGMMDQQSQTISGTWSTFMDGLEQSAAQVGLQIAEALNLTGLFQSLGDILTNFAATVQSSGLTEALLTAIPPEFQV